MSTESAVATFPRGNEDGFTLVEILVVIIIIGILAAIAIPIFLNQQRAARDSATTQDARNLVSSVETALVSDPTPEDITILPKTNVLAASDTYTVVLRTHSGETIEVKGSKTLGTWLNVYEYKDTGRYHVTAFNPNGQEYTGTSVGESILLYDSGVGGFKTWTYK